MMQPLQVHLRKQRKRTWTIDNHNM
jgi:hypothetical protein